MRIEDNKRLILNVKNPDRITSVIPKSKVIQRAERGARVAVHWGLEEATILKNLGFDNVPSPILRDYKWPGIDAPLSHQKTTAAFLTLHRRGYCFNQQGTGKTRSALWACDYLMNKGVIKKVLILCPLSIMESAWVDDLFKTAMHRTVRVAYSKNAKTRRQIIAENHAEFVIMNYDGLEIAQKEIAAAGFDLVIVDEANSMKSATTKRWKTFNSLLKPHMWLWMMTGTPAAQSPIDAYGLAKLVSPSKTPQFFGTFRDQVMMKVTNFKWVPKPDADRIVHNLLQPAIRFTKEECLDLPEMTYITRDTPLTPQQNKYYEILRKHFLAQAAGEDITAVNAAAGMNKLLQISGGSVYSDKKEIVEFDCKNRLTVLKEVIDESSNKVLVFIPYRHAIERVTENLRSDGYDVEVINGAVSAGRRTEIFKTFQTTPKIKVLIIQPQAASHGVTLHAADTIVYWSPVLSVETYLQCNARVHRAGLRHPATVVHLQGSPIEKKVYKMLQDKVDSHEKLVDLYKEVLNEY